MTRIYCRILWSICLAGTCMVCGCSDATNTVEIPANPKPAPGLPSAFGSDPSGNDTKATAPQITPE